ELLDLPKNAAGAVGAIQRNAERLTAMTEQLGILAAVTSDARVSIKREPIDLATIAARVCDRLRGLAEAAGIVLRVTGACERKAMGESGLIEHALENLIMNAVRHAGGTSLVRVDLAATELAGRPAVSIAVIDQGPGIASENRERIFEAFWKAGKPGGSGLGLAIVQSIAEALGGSVSVSDTDPAGTSFTLIFRAA
ncbi:MAG: HAMP domain-containing sensor histidine kinase, partial [Planctomycetota bacterium]